MPRFNADPLNLPTLESPIPLSAAALQTPKTGLWNKICTIVSRIFGVLSCGKGLDNLFDQREISLLRNDRIVPPSSLPPQLLPDHLVIPMTTNEERPEEPAQPNQVLPRQQFDETLEEARIFLRDLVNLTLDVIDKEHIEPQIEAFQQLAPSFPPVVKSFAKLIIEMGDKAAKPLFKKLAEQKSEVIDPTLRKMLKTLLRTGNTNLRGDLFQYLKHELERRPLPKGQKPLDYIKPIMSWIFPKENERPLLASLFPSDGTYDSHLIDILCEKAQAFYQTYNVSDLDRLYYRMENKIHKDLKDFKIPQGQDLDNNYIKPILNWLLCSEQLVPIYSLFSPQEQFDANLIDKVFESAIIFLVERKIDHYATILEKTLKRRLGEILQNTIRVNALNIANYFSARFAELITNMPYTKTVDNLISQVFAKHIEGYLVATKGMENHLKVLSKARRAIKLDAKTPAQIKVKKEAEEHLASVQNHGGEEKFLYDMFLEEFSRQPCCNPNIKKIIDQHLYNVLQKKDPSHAIPGIESSMYALLAGEITKLMLPSKKVINESGQVEERDPLVDLWNQLYLPDEFYELLKHVEELASEFITPEIVSLFASVKEPLLAGIEKLAMTLAQELLKNQLVDIIKKSFEIFANSENLDELAAETLLPNLNEQILKVFVKQELGRNVAVTSPLFHDLILAIPAQREEEIEKLQDIFLGMVKNKFNKFSPVNFYVTEAHSGGKAVLSYSNLTDASIKYLILNYIEYVEERLKEKMREPDRVHPALTLNEVREVMKKLSLEKDKDNIPIFGEIVMNMIFKVGEWRNEGLIGFFIKDAISKGISTGTKEFRMNYHYLIQTMVGGLRSTFLDPVRISKMINSHSSSPPQHTKEKLQHQIDVTSRISYDMIIGLAGDQGAIAKFTTKKYFNEDHKTLSTLITRIYEKVLGDRILNENILMQVMTEIFRGFAASAETIRAQESQQMQNVVTQL